MRGARARTGCHCCEQAVKSPSLQPQRAILSGRVKQSFALAHWRSVDVQRRGRRCGFDRRVKTRKWDGPATGWQQGSKSDQQPLPAAPRRTLPPVFPGPHNFEGQIHNIFSGNSLGASIYEFVGVWNDISVASTSTLFINNTATMVNSTADPQKFFETE
jgi:hypothetical protein